MEIRTIDEGHRHKRVLRVEEEEVAHLWVIDHTMRINAAEVRMAGIGGVYTERKHRMKGYMRHLFEDTVAYMIEEGYDVSMLFGIPNFYTRFGYATALPIYKFAIKTRDAEAAQPRAESYASRPIEPRDMEGILELYNTANATRTGSLVRDPDAFQAFRKGTNWDVRADTALWEDGDGQLLAYAVWDRQATAVNVAELEAADRRLFPTLLSAFARQAVEKRCETITFYVPPDHAFAEYAQRYGTVWTIEYPRHSDGMMRILNQQPIFEKLAPVFAHRVEGSCAPDLPRALTIETELGRTGVRFDDGKVEVITDGPDPAGLRLPQHVLIQLLMGYRSVRDVLEAPGVTLEGAITPLLTRLFPKDVPHVWKPDYF